MDVKKTLTKLTEESLFTGGDTYEKIKSFVQSIWC